MKLIDWQIYWKSWHLGIDKFEDDEDGMAPYKWTMYYVFIGPVQMRWIRVDESWWRIWKNART